MKQILLLMIPGLLIGCANITGQTNFNEHIDTIEHHLTDADWEVLEEQGDHLKRLYEDEQWKLQLLGDEGEYEGLNIGINRFLKAIEEEDMIEAKLELATIQTLIDDIYSL